MSETKKRKRGRPKKSETIEKNKNSFAFLKDEKFKFLVGIFLIFLTFYSAISFFSFLFTWKSDMGLFDQGFFNIISSQVKPSNAMGKLGAYISIVFIYRWFGISAFGFLFVYPLWALKLFNVKIKKYRSMLFKTLGAIVWLSLTLALLFGKHNFAIGGAYPYQIVKWISTIVGKFGTGFILFLAALAFVFFNFEKSFDWTKQFLQNIIKNRSLKFKYRPKNQDETKTNNQNTESPNNTMDDNNFYKKDSDEDDLMATIYEDTSTKQNPPEKLIEDKGFIIMPDGTKVPRQNNNVGGIGFEIEDTSKNNDVIDDINEEEINPNQNIPPVGIPPIKKMEYVGANVPINNPQKLPIQEGMEVIHNDDVFGDMTQMEDFDPTKTLSYFKLPILTLLKNHKIPDSEVTEQELLENRNKIIETLKNYKIEITKIKATVGPTVTLYEIIPAPGIRISRIKNLEDDIALSLAALGIRIIAPMPGRGTVGIEVPNQKPAIVSMRSVLSSKAYQKSDYELPVALGKTISNETYVFDLTKMPHLLIAGATGQGKSVGLNAILTSIIYKKHPAFVKFVLIDPKKVELVIYEKIERHYLAKLPGEDDAIITDNKKVIYTLNSLNKEMDQRYDLLKDAKVRNIIEYNKKFIERKLNPKKGHKFLPYIVLVIDEFADLIMTAGKEVEVPIARLAQLARAVGIHLIVATQRPSTNIITGMIKANFPARIAFKVASMIDSRTILDSPGANQLIGRGDMLITRGNDLIRLQCAFIDTDEINAVVDYVESQIGYPEAFNLPEPDIAEEGEASNVDLSKRDALFEDAAKLIVINQSGSTSLIQRKLAIGYNRAGRIMDQLEAAGIVGPAQGSKPREVYYNDIEQLIGLLNSIS